MESYLVASAFHRCREEFGLPVRLVGENDVFSFPAAESFSFTTSDPYKYYDPRTGTCVRLTTHRIFWRESSGWFALRLDTIKAVETIGGFLSSVQVFLQLLSVNSVTVKCSEAAEFADRVLQVFLPARNLCYEAIAISGLQRVMGQRDGKLQAASNVLDVAANDLDALRQHAVAAVTAVRQLQRHGKASESGSIEQLLDEFGLLNHDGSPIVSGGYLGSDIEADVVRVCQAALEKRGGFGMLLAHDVFCLVNRARGTALVSPKEVMCALKLCDSKHGPLRLRVLGSTSAFAVSLRRTSDVEADEKLLQFTQSSPLSAFRLTMVLGLTAAEAQFILHDAVARGVLVRDDSYAGVFYYRNIFDTF